MIRRIDLRSAATGRAAGEPFDYRTALPRADFDVEAAVPAVHAITEAVRTGGIEAIQEMSAKFDGVERDRRRGWPPRRCARALEELDPAIRAGLEESDRAAAQDVRERARARRGHRPRPRCSGDAPQGADRPGRPLRARRPGAAGLERADERGARPDRRGALAGAGLPAAEGLRWRGAPHDPRGLRDARCRGGVRRRRRPGDRDVRLRGRPVRARRHGHRTGQHLRGRPPSGCSRAWSASTPRPARPRSRSWPTTPRRRRTSPPTWSARPSTTRWPRACW